jgi:16S rRNA (uracil1498-N3)-methyltransferase
MNLILLSKSDFITPTKVRLTDRRLTHLQEILNVKEGQVLTVGHRNGLMGEGIITKVSDDEVELEVNCKTEPPPALPLTLILALPRPHVLRRTLISAASLGIKKIIILNFNRVEKSLWNSSALKAEAVDEQLILGLEQSRDTIMPEVILKDRFKPFVEDELPRLIEGTVPLIAHPGGGEACPQTPQKPVTLIIGPEGGIIDFEMAHLKEIGFKPIDLGPRILRVETVLPYLIGTLYGGVL